MDNEQVGQLAASVDAKCIETHISWVLLAGDLAWKIKKPVRLPFVDYATLESRRRCCEEELRLNRRLAPGLYQGLETITLAPQGPRFGPGSPVLDFAVRMRRFPQEDLLSSRLAAHAVLPADVDALADLLCAFHAAAPPAAIHAEGGAAAQARARARAACRGAAPCFTPEMDGPRLERWIETEADALESLWNARARAGRVREVHGDLHLENIVWIDGAPAAFDAVEFAPELRCIDILEDVAFAVMDFCARGSRGFAFRLLNRWLDGLGEHEAVPALRFSVVYRALVRAQVMGLRRDGVQARTYARCAWAWAEGRAQGRLCITHGLPGSGKTWRSQAWLEREGAIRIRSDVERKRLVGLEPLADSRAAGLDLYTPEMTRRTYARLLSLAEAVLLAGHSVILDAAFLRRAERQMARDLARRLDAGFSILHCEASLAVLRARLHARRGDPSEADATVLDQLLATAEPLDADEREQVEAA